MSFLRALIVHTSFLQHVPQSGTSPTTVHDRTISLIDAVDFFEESPHGMATVAGTLECARNGVLREVVGKLVDAEGQRVGDSTIDLDKVRIAVDVKNGSMITVIGAFFGDEASDQSDKPLLLKTLNRDTWI